MLTRSLTLTQAQTLRRLTYWHVCWADKWSEKIYIGRHVDRHMPHVRASKLLCLLGFSPGVRSSMVGNMAQDGEEEKMLISKSRGPYPTLKWRDCQPLFSWCRGLSNFLSFGELEPIRLAFHFLAASWGNAIVVTFLDVCRNSQSNFVKIVQRIKETSGHPFSSGNCGSAHGTLDSFPWIQLQQDPFVTL